MYGCSNQSRRILSGSIHWVVVALVTSLDCKFHKLYLRLCAPQQPRQLNTGRRHWIFCCSQNSTHAKAMLRQNDCESGKAISLENLQGINFSNDGRTMLQELREQLLASVTMQYDWWHGNHLLFFQYTGLVSEGGRCRTKRWRAGSFCRGFEWSDVIRQALNKKGWWRQTDKQSYRQAKAAVFQQK